MINQTILDCNFLRKEKQTGVGEYTNGWMFVPFKDVKVYFPVSALNPPVSFFKGKAVYGKL